MKWTEFKVVTTEDAYEAIVAIMYEIGATGLFIDDPRDIIQNKKDPTDWDYIEDELISADMDKITIRAYFSEEINTGEKVLLFKEKLNLVKDNFEVKDEEVVLNDIFEENWASNWKKYYKPTEIGNKIVIRPSWEEYSKSLEGKVEVVMDPGMAFGTGTHETTKMCMIFLEKYINKNDRLLDLGCGSGIIGICGVKLGAQSCYSVDIDPKAITVAKENISMNGLKDKISADQGNLTDSVEGKYDIIIANIIADVIIELSSIITPYLNKGGTMIASGIIKERYEEVKNSLEDDNFNVIEELFMGEWVACVVKKKSFG